MSTQANTTKTGTTATSQGSSMFSNAFTGYNPIIIIFTLLSIGMFTGSFIATAQFIGGKEDWNLIQPQVIYILCLTLIGTVGLMVASFFYYIQDPAKTIYFILILCCLSLGLSYAALAIAAISR
jgi:hypothetical protein